MQRTDINGKKLTTIELLEEWPYFFHLEGFAQHYEDLVGHDPKKTLKTSLIKKS